MLHRSFNALFLFFVFFCVGSSELLAASDYKGLFGSYRREEFVENEANNSNFGIDILLSTLFPLKPFIESQEDATTGGPLHYSTFFNFELNFFYTIAYNWEFYGRLGIYKYDTRKENTIHTDPALPLFHQFELSAFPVMLGVKYRLSRSDLVPYFGAGAGLAYVERRGFYDYSVQKLNDYSTVLILEAVAGVEFFFSHNSGLRLEVSAFHMKLPSNLFDPLRIVQTGGTGGITIPALVFKPNPISIRYASGIFVLF